ncbi:MAG TPA: hypothetical protein VJ487_14705 [Alphaproteobacteria bacterium]|nr:hypothetical protein [Alphaproteobacteria bacterium]
MARSSTTVAIRPPADRTSTTSQCDRFDRADAPPLGLRRVLTQVCHDLYGTKDVQDAITASYVWMADQIGHLTLGLAPTILLCWIATLFWPTTITGCVWRCAIFGAAAALVFAYWVYKELTDLKETRARAGHVFPFDSGDIVWNVKTALLYFGIGGLIAVGAFISWQLFLLALLLTGWPALRVAFWWLRRKLAFQQAGLPYLYRLANFTTKLAPNLLDTVSHIANLKNRKTLLLKVLFWRDVVPEREPAIRHVMITGPLGAGKTSLCVGIGTEFAFALGKGRYLSATKLVQLVLADQSKGGDRDYDDGRVLWRWRDCDLLLIDDVDAGVSSPDVGVPGGSAHLIEPEVFVRALSDGKPRPPLDWLGPRRSVWVLGDPSEAASWRRAIAGLMQVGERDIALVELGSTSE